MRATRPRAIRRAVLLAGLVLALGQAATGAGGTGSGSLGNISKKVREEISRNPDSAVNALVRFRTDPATARRVVGSLGGTVWRQHRSGWMAVRLRGRDLEALAGTSAVGFVASDVPVFAAMDIGRAAAALPGPEAPETALKGAGVTIAMIDSGVAPHPDIEPLVTEVDYVGAWDSCWYSGSVDENGHGTHVAGIMVGTGRRSTGRRFAGVAPEAGLVSLRVLDASGRGQTSTMLAALEWVLQNRTLYGIRVLNLSVGHPVYEAATVDPLVQAVEALWDAGVVVVCAAGNGGRDGHGTISSPCNSPKVITVGALNDRATLDRSDDTVTTFSSRGPTRIDRVAKPDLVAPGNRIVSLRARGSLADQLYPERRVAGLNLTVPEYFEMSGASMAAPFVSAAAALMLQQEPWLNPSTVKARLMLSARKPALGSPFVTGAGALDVLAALRTAGEVPTAPSPRVSPDSSGAGALLVENTGVLWSNPVFSLPALWSQAVLWSDPALWGEPVLSSSGVVLPGTGGSASLWPEASLWSEATLWPESTLWSEWVLWDNGQVSTSSTRPRQKP